MLVFILHLFFLMQVLRLQESYVEFKLNNIAEYSSGLLATISNNLVLLVGVVMLFNSIGCLLWSLLF